MPKTAAKAKTTAAKAPAIPLLSRLRPPKGAVRNEKRVGRGVGSGLGKTAGHGQKGQTARHKRDFGKLGFEGGQTPLYRRIPKRGFFNVFARNMTAINLNDLDKFKAGATVDEAALREAGIINRKSDGIKLLGTGDIDRALKIKLHAISASAKQKIEAAGGSVELLTTKTEEA